MLSLWAARSHLLGVFRGLGRPTHLAEDPPRWAFLGLAASLLFCSFWSYAAGLKFHLGLIYFALFFIFSIGIARLRIDGGIPLFLGLPMVSHLFYIVGGTGPGVYGESDYVVFAHLNILTYGCLGTFLAMQLEGWKIGEEVGIKTGKMTIALVMSLLVGLFVGYYFSLNTIYEYGMFVLDNEGGALSEARIGRYYPYSYQSAGDLESPTDWLRIFFHFVGFSFVWFLTIMRKFFLRWPFHPIGYIFAVGFGKAIWGSILVGWFLKWIIVKYGGAVIFRRAKPFFLGLILGELTMKLVWACVGTFAGKIGQAYGM